MEQNLYVEINTLGRNDIFNLIEYSKNLEAIFKSVFGTYNNVRCSKILKTIVKENISLILPKKERLKEFYKSLDVITRKNYGAKAKLDRYKMMHFKEKDTVDRSFEFTIFSQLFHEQALIAFIPYKGEQFFRVELKGEGATDQGGPFRDILSTMCDELQSKYLDLFIPTPNSVSELGSYRDRYMINPDANTPIHLERFEFLGKIFAAVVLSGNVLNLNLHPLFWNLLLGEDITFKDLETYDKLFFKSISDIESLEDITYLGYDLNFTIQNSKGNEIALVYNGKEKIVNNENKSEYLALAKDYRLNEFNIQKNALRKGFT